MGDQHEIHTQQFNVKFQDSQHGLWFTICKDGIYFPLL